MKIKIQGEASESEASSLGNSSRVVHGKVELSENELWLNAIELRIVGTEGR